MLSSFPYHYPIDAERVSKIWKSALLVFDASTLLNMYDYSQHTQQQFISLLASAQKDLWIPHQFAMEFIRNRKKVIRRQLRLLEDAKKALETTKKQLQDSITSLLSNKLVKTEIHNPITSIIDSKLNTLEGHIKLQRELLSKDPFHNGLAKHFDDRVGPGPTREELLELFKEGEIRFKFFIPPGFKDSNEKQKQMLNPYGDYVAWSQILNHAKKTNRPVIFIMDDLKLDWWIDEHGSPSVPRPELRAEFHAEVGQEFMMYTLPSFVEAAMHENRGKLSAEALEEMKIRAKAAQEKKNIEASMESPENKKKTVVTELVSSDAPKIDKSTNTKKTTSVLEKKQPTESEVDIQRAI